MVLDIEAVEYEAKDPSKLDNWAKLGLYGHIFDRWFDKSICLIIFRNGNCAFNFEHSYADGPVSCLFPFYIWHIIIIIAPRNFSGGKRGPPREGLQGGSRVGVPGGRAPRTPEKFSNKCKKAMKILQFFKKFSRKFRDFFKIV